MEGLLEALSNTPLAQWMRYSRWGYAVVNTAHILGIALLVGSIFSFNLRLLGLWSDVAIEPLVRVLIPVAAAGLMLAIITGSLLFLAGPADYAGSRVFILKITLVTAGLFHAIIFRLNRTSHANPIRLRTVGVFSLVIWLSVLILGRFIAFMET